jgi:tRNA 2-selenouridine synthase
MLQLDQPIYIDMRSPLEFSIGHILDAINIPLFSDEERAQVGTLYQQVGVEQAKELGLTIASSKLPDIVSQIKNLSKTGRPIIVYCWRGGMRSKSIVTVLNLMGIPAQQLIGGYKIYRRHVLDSLLNIEIKPKIIVLCGSTGVGKTSLLEILKRLKIPIIDLEKLANHRGSVFGQIGLGKATTAQFFDETILLELQHLNEQPYIVVECESKRIGNVYLPECLYQAMHTGVQILVHTDIEIRISRLIAEYTDFKEIHSQEIITSLKALTKRFGPKKMDELVSDFEKGNIRNVVGILLTNYYDPLYGYENSTKKSYDLTVNCNDLELAALQIVDYIGKLGR